MTIVHQGFDGLDVAFDGKISEGFERVLSAAKATATEQCEPELIEFNGVEMHVAETGGKGGYAYRCDTGPEGAVWWFKRVSARGGWGIRVSVRSLPLALFGLGAVRARINDTLDRLGIKIPECGESIGRVDYAVDFLAPDLDLDAGHFITGSRSWSRHREGDQRTEYGTAGRSVGVTIGKMPGAQVCAYDKRAETLQKRKVHWPEIWNANLAAMGRPPLDNTDATTSRVWRIEVRAGKDCLKDRWGIRHWHQLHDKLGDVFLSMVGAVRYVLPNSDPNPSRWPEMPIWSELRSAIAEDLFEMRSNAEPQRVLEVVWDEHRKMLVQQCIGLQATVAALDGEEAENFSKFLIGNGRMMAEAVRRDPGRVDEQFRRAQKRYATKRRAS